MLHELDYIRVFIKEVTIQTTGEIVIEHQDEQKISGHLPLTRPILGILTLAESFQVNDEITLKLAEVKGWDARRLLRKPFICGDEKYFFIYILDDNLLRAVLEAGDFAPLYLKDCNTGDLQV